MESLLEAFRGVFSSEDTKKNVVDGGQPSEAYLRSIDIPELWVRIFLEVDLASHQAQAVDAKNETMKTKKKKQKKPRPNTVLKLSEVCKAWRDVVYCNDVWKVLAKRRWKEVKLKARIRNWKQFYARRYMAECQIAPLKSHAVQNCSTVEFEYECPIVVELMATPGNLKTRFCDTCKETVYICKDEIEIEYHIAQKHCIAFDEVSILRICHSISLSFSIYTIIINNCCFLFHQLDLIKECYQIANG